jgi:hypothetical protein
MNRFPPQHLEGYEHLIQDPYKLNDEVRGRREEYARLLDDGTPLDCRQPERCRYCYLQRLCDTLDDVRAVLRDNDFRVVRVDTEWESRVGPVFGGDPASSKKARQAAEDMANHVGFESAAMGDTFRDEAVEKPRVRLPLLMGKAPEPVPSVEARVASVRPEVLWITAPTLPRALTELARFPDVPALVLELDDAAGLHEALVDGRLHGRRLHGVRTRSADTARALLDAPGDFEVAVALTRETAPWLLALTEAPARLALFQPTYERLTENAQHDVDLRDFFARFPHAVPVEAVPACVLGRAPRAQARTLDTAMLLPDGRPEIFRYAKRYILEHYRSKSLRCKGCEHYAGCDGMHINHVRAHGYSLMQPVVADAG